jgi:hypothetical protein
MATRISFPARSTRILLILVSVIYLLVSTQAQHGGGGGHSGGGHVGRGHSSGGHSSARRSGGSNVGGHFGWLHFWPEKHSGRHPGFGVSSVSDTSPHLTSHLGNIPRPARLPPSPRILPTLLWSPPLFPHRPDVTVSFVFSHLRRRRGFFFCSFPRFSSSGCFFNGVSQVCFFEPFLPLLSFSGDFDPYYSGFGFRGDSLDLGDEFSAQKHMQSEMSAVSPPVNPSDDETAEGNSSVRPGATLATEEQALGKGVFLLVLKNDTSHAVTDYWVADGYLEYISADGTRGHIPLEALDLQKTVTQNAPRSLPFVLRFAPAQNR